MNDFNDLTPIQLEELKKNISISLEQSKLLNQDLYHGTTENHVLSVKAGPKNLGRGFGGQGLYCCVGGQNTADEFASIAAAGNKGNAVILKGRVNPHPSLRIAEITLKPRAIGAQANLLNGVFPPDWAKNPKFEAFMKDNFDVVIVNGAKKGGYATAPDRFAVFHESAGSKANFDWASQTLSVNTGARSAPVTKFTDLTEQPFKLTTKINGVWGELQGTCHLESNTKQMPFVKEIKSFQFTAFENQKPPLTAVGRVESKARMAGSLVGLGVAAWNIYGSYNASVDKNPEVAAWLHLGAAVGAELSTTGVWMAIGCVAGACALFPITVATIAARNPNPFNAFKHAKDQVNLEDLDQHELSDREEIENIMEYGNRWGPTLGISQDKLDAMSAEDVYYLNPERLENAAFWQLLEPIGKPFNQLMDGIRNCVLNTIPEASAVSEPDVQTAAQAVNTSSMVDLSHHTVPLSFYSVTPTWQKTLATQLSPVVGFNPAIHTKSNTSLDVPLEHTPKWQQSLANQFDPSVSVNTNGTNSNQGHLNIQAHNPKQWLKDQYPIDAKQPISYYTDMLPKHSPKQHPVSEYLKNVNFDVKYDSRDGGFAVIASASWKFVQVPIIPIVVTAVCLIGEFIYGNFKRKKAKEEKKRTERQITRVAGEIQTDQRYHNKALNHLNAYLEETDPTKKAELWEKTCADLKEATEHNQNTRHTNDQRADKDRKMKTKPHSSKSHKHYARKPTREYIEDVALPNLKIIGNNLEQAREVLFQALLHKISQYSDESINQSASDFVESKIDEAAFLAKVEQQDQESQAIINQIRELQNILPKKDKDKQEILHELKQLFEDAIEGNQEFVKSNIEIRKINEENKAAFLRSVFDEKLDQLSVQFLAGKLTQQQFEANIEAISTDNIKADPAFISSNIESRAFNDRMTAFYSDLRDFEAALNSLSAAYHAEEISEQEFEAKIQEIQRESAARLSSEITAITSDSKYIEANKPASTDVEIEKPDEPTVDPLEQVQAGLTAESLQYFFEENRSRKTYNDLVHDYNEHSVYSGKTLDGLDALSKQYLEGIISEQKFRTDIAKLKNALESLLEIGPKMMALNNDEETTQSVQAVEGVDQVLANKPITMAEYMKNCHANLNLLQDYLPERIIRRTLIEIESYLINSNLTDAENKMLSEGFEKVNQEWSQLKNKESSSGLMLLAARLAYQAKKYDVAKLSVESVIDVDPKNFDALMLWIQANVAEKAPEASTLAFLIKYEANYTEPREQAICALLKGELLKDKSQLTKAFELLKALSGQERLHYLARCFHLIDSMDSIERQVKMSVVHADVPKLLHLDQCFVMIKAYSEQIDALKQQIVLESDNNCKTELEQALSDSELGFKGIILLTQDRLSYCKSEDMQRVAKHVSYANLGSDLLIRAFGERVARSVGARAPKEEVAALRPVIADGFSVIEDIQSYRVNAAEKVHLADLSELGDLSQADKEKVEYILNANNTEMVHRIGDLFRTAGSIVLALRLVVSLSNYMLFRCYLSAMRNVKGKPPTFEEWLRTIGEETLVAQAASWTQQCSTGLDWANWLQNAIPLMTMFNSKNVGIFAGCQLGINTLVFFPYLSDRLLNDLDEDHHLPTNWYRLFLGCFIKNMNSGGWTSFLAIHQNTLLCLLRDMLVRNDKVKLAGEFISLDPRVMYILFSTKILFSLGVSYFNNSYFSNVSTRQADARIHNLQADLKQMIREIGLGLAQPDQHAALFLRAEKLFQHVKEEAEYFGAAHPLRQQVYIKALFEQHRVAGELESHAVKHGGNGFFNAVASYTEETPVQLREMAVDYISVHRSFFEDFLETTMTDYLVTMQKHNEPVDELMIRALSSALKRPIIIVFLGMSLDLNRQGLFAPDTIPSEGEPIFVEYDEVKELYDALWVKGETFFERIHLHHLKACQKIKPKAELQAQRPQVQAPQPDAEKAAKAKIKRAAAEAMEEAKQLQQKQPPSQALSAAETKERAKKAQAEAIRLGLQIFGNGSSKQNKNIALPANSREFALVKR